MSSLPETDMRQAATEQDPSKKKRWLIWAVAGLAIVGIIVGCSVGFTRGNAKEQTVSGSSAQGAESTQAIVTSKKSKYSTEDNIDILFENENPSPDDWIAVAKAGSEKDGLIAGEDAQFFAWVFACGTQTCDDAVEKGIITLKAGSIPEGEYQTFVITNAEEPYKVKGSSKPFTILAGPKPSLRPTEAKVEETAKETAEESAEAATEAATEEPAEEPEEEPAEAVAEEAAEELAEETEEEQEEDAEDEAAEEAAEEAGDEGDEETNEETADETSEQAAEDAEDAAAATTEGSKVVSAKALYQKDESITISFVNADAKRGDWIAIAKAGAHLDDDEDKLEDDKDIKFWSYACGDQKCTKRTHSGTFEIFKGTLTSGNWQAYLLKTDRGAPYRIKAMSEVFEISSEDLPVVDINEESESDNRLGLP